MDLHTSGFVFEERGQSGEDVIVIYIIFPIVKIQVLCEKKLINFQSARWLNTTRSRMQLGWSSNRILTTQCCLV